jgi:excisionase family DNA binding protein
MPAQAVGEMRAPDAAGHLNVSPRPLRRIEDSDAAAFGQVPRRDHRDKQIRFFTIAEVADHLRVSARTIRRWIAAGELIVHRPGGIIRIAEADLRAFLAVHRDG